jgi:hypothetical protein
VSPGSRAPLDRRDQQEVRAKKATLVLLESKVARDQLVGQVPLGKQDQMGRKVLLERRATLVRVRRAQQVILAIRAKEASLAPRVPRVLLAWRAPLGRLAAQAVQGLLAQLRLVQRVLREPRARHRFT